MAKVYTHEHTDRFILIRKYLKKFLGDRKTDDDLACCAQYKTAKECVDKLFEYKKLMPEYVKNLMKKGESFTIEKSGNKHYLSNEETKDEIEGRIEISSDDLDSNCEFFAYMDHAEFENNGLEYCFSIINHNEHIFTPEKNWKIGSLTRNWRVIMDPIGKDTWNELLSFVKITYEEYNDVTNDRREIILFTNISAGDVLNISISDKSGDEDKPQCWENEKFYCLAEEELNVLKDYAGVPRRQKLIKDGLPF